jgi:hypothetical protein
MSARRRGGPLLVLVAVGALGSFTVAITGTVMAILGSEIACMGGGGPAIAAPATKVAVREIPRKRLRIYQQAGQRFDVDWAFLASIGYQECGHSACAHVYPSGCGGPMQIAIVRESACNPGPGPTIWERYKVDADGGGADPFDPADAIFTAARMLRPVFGLAGGSYAAYRQVACNYYGSCADGAADYADEVMARAVSYGFHGQGAPAGAEGIDSIPVAYEGGGCGGAVGETVGPLGPVHRAFAPRRLAVLPGDVSAAPGIQCDARIVPNVVYLARRFGVLVSSCYSPSGHEATGEHPLGAAIDAGPRDGDWARTMRLARFAAWRASCASSGVAPACARPPFRFVGYNGYSNHGDPAHCAPCAGGPHIHLSWLTSASEGQAENRARFGYEPASWIEVFATSSEPDLPARPARSRWSKTTRPRVRQRPTDRIPRTSRAAPPPAEQLALRSHQALQHVPYRRGELAITLVGARGHRALLRVSAPTLSSARHGWRAFLRRYHDRGEAYIARFVARSERRGR